MASIRQITAARENIKKAQDKWKSMSSTERSRLQPKGRMRAKPGSKKETGNYYHISVRPRTKFTSFRVQDVGRKGHSQRVAGKRESGNWDTQKWLISKKDAHVEGSKLIADEPKVKTIISNLGSEVKHVRGDIFEAKPRENIPEKDKSTFSQKIARKENIKKDLEARRK